MIILLAFFYALFFTNFAGHEHRDRMVRHRELKIMEDLNLTDQKNAIVREAETFLKREFGFHPESVSVMMENAMILIRVEKFLCSAEQKIGVEKQNANLLHQLYAKIFDTVKGPFVDRINQITERKVVSSQIGINFKTKNFLIKFFFS